MDISGESQRAHSRDVTILRHTLIVLSLLVLAFLAWKLSGVLLLAFGALIMAVVLRAFGDLIAWATRLPPAVALVAAAAIIIGGLLTGVYLLGTQAIQQFVDLGARLSEVIARLEAAFNAQGAVERFATRAAEAGPFSGMLSNIAGVTATILGGIANTLLIAFGAVYLAAQPKLYRTGLIRLVPPSQRGLAVETFDAIGRALRMWLMGQVVAMILVGALTTIGLIAIGMPSALALGLIAGLTNFIPFVGPVAAAVPALLIAASVSGTMILWTLALYVVIQQLEGNFITPLIERRAVSIPPALTIFAIVAAGVLFGPLGVIFGAPLTVVAYVGVTKLYVTETLGDPAEVPGEEPD